LADFKKLGATVVGISYDPTDVLTKFQQEEEAPQRFVSDPKGTAADAFGVAASEKGEQYAKRATFIIRDGTVLHVVFDWSPLGNVNKTFDWLSAHPQ
jgi:peroxiredoxin